jgi:hypothetical protein
VAVEESYLDNPERGTLVYSLVGITKDAAGEAKEKVLAFIDKNAQGRIVLEEGDVLEIN